jgi:hypothetical protein
MPVELPLHLLRNQTNIMSLSSIVLFSLATLCRLVSGRDDVVCPIATRFDNTTRYVNYRFQSIVIDSHFFGSLMFVSMSGFKVPIPSESLSKLAV